MYYALLGDIEECLWALCHDFAEYSWRAMIQREECVTVTFNNPLFLFYHLRCQWRTFPWGELQYIPMLKTPNDLTQANVAQINTFPVSTSSQNAVLDFNEIWQDFTIKGDSSKLCQPGGQPLSDLLDKIQTPTLWSEVKFSGLMTLLGFLKISCHLFRLFLSFFAFLQGHAILPREWPT